MNRPSVLQVGGTLYWVILTRDPDTMVLKDADSTPMVAVRKNGASTADSVTVIKRSATTGIYDCSYNPASEVEGDKFTFEESATVTGTTTAQATYENSWELTVIAVERGTEVIVSPLQAVGPERVAGTEIVAYINDTSPIGPIAVTDADGVAIDLSALTLKVCIEKIDGTILANVSPSISGTDNNQVTFTPNADSVAKTGTFRWSLRKTSNNQVYALGDFIVDPAARISP